MKNNASQPDSGRPARRRVRRLIWWVRSLILVVAVLCLLGGGAMWYVLRPSFLISQIRPELEQRLGGDVRIGTMHYLGAGRFSLEHFSLHARGLPDEAARVAAVAYAELGIDLGELLHGRLELIELELDGVDIRLSQAVDDDQLFNFMHLDPIWPAGDGPPILPPQVRIRSARIERGTHDATAYTPTRARNVAGQMYPIRDLDEGWYSVELGEVDDRGIGMGDDGILVRGQWNALSYEFVARIDGLELDDETYAMCPASAQFWWDRMQLEGNVGAVVAQYLHDQPFSVEFEVDDVSMTLPVETEGIWARYQQGRIVPERGLPRMKVGSGRIRLGTDRLKLENMHGELRSATEDDTLIGVPYRFSLEITDLPTLDKFRWPQREQWVDEVLAAVPFRMDFELEDFHLHGRQPVDDPAIELPVVVADVLERFSITDWVLSSEITVSRAPATIDDQGALVPQPIESSGKAYISQASARYVEFPYPLTGIDAYLEFENDVLTIHYLEGRGSNDGRLRISGTVSPLNNYPKVDLTLTASNLPLDDRLANAMGQRQREALQSFLDQDAFQRMLDAGVLADVQYIERTRQESVRLATQIAALRAQGAATEEQDATIAASIADLRRRQQRLLRVVENGAFTMGGTVNLDLNILRTEGQGESTDTIGTVEMNRIGVVVRHFPYPFTILSGSIELLRDGVRIIDAGESGDAGGLHVVTTAGGTGYLTGTVRSRRNSQGQSVIEPDLHIRVVDDVVNDNLVEVISGLSEPQATAPIRIDPDDASQESFSASDLFRSIDLAGDLDYVGDVVSNEQGDTEYEFTISLANGSARPTPRLTELIGGMGLVLPDGFALAEVSGLLRVTHDRIELVQFEAEHPAGEVFAVGRIEPGKTGSETTLSLRMNDLPLGEYLIRLLPEAQARQTRELWDKYDPAGSFNTELRIHTGAQSSELAVVFEPGDIIARIGEHDMHIHREHGRLLVRGTEIQLDDLALRISRDNVPHGVVRLNGVYGAPVNTDDPTTLRIHGAWENGQFDSPIILETLRLLGAQDELERYVTAQPHGVFDAIFNYDSATTMEPSRYALTIQPRSIALTIDGTQLAADMTPTSRIRFQPDRIELMDVAGRHADGLFAVGGTVYLDPPVRMDLNLDYQGYVLASEGRALLPQRVEEIFDAIEFREHQPTHISNLALQLRRRQPAEIQAEPDAADWIVDLHGDIITTAARIKTGIEVDDLTGCWTIDLKVNPTHAPRLNVKAELNSLNVFNTALSEARVTLHLNDAADHLVLESLRASTHGGTLAANGRVDLANRAYSLNVGAVGVGLTGLLGSVEDEESGHEPASDVQPMMAGDGQIWARLSLSGQHDHPEARRGRGAVRVIGDELGEIPFALRLSQVLQFSLSFDDQWDYADADFYIDGNRLVMDRILFESTVDDRVAQLQLLGQGEVDLDSMQLLARFRSRGGVMILRDIIGGIGDQLYQIELFGQLKDPRSRVVALPNLN
jgi:hypothetical protein